MISFLNASASATETAWSKTANPLLSKERIKSEDDSKDETEEIVSAKEESDAVISEGATYCSDEEDEEDDDEEDEDEDEEAEVVEEVEEDWVTFKSFDICARNESNSSNNKSAIFS